MSTPVNLNKVRKTKAKSVKATRADVNAVKFGRSKSARKSDEVQESKRVTSLEAHKRET